MTILAGAWYLGGGAYLLLDDVCTIELGLVEKTSGSRIGLEFQRIHCVEPQARENGGLLR